MPHIIVKHTHDADINAPKLLQDLHASLAAQDTINEAQIKTYAEPLAHCVVSDSAQPNNMIHIQVRMKPGRSEELRKKCAGDIHTIARAHVDGRKYACAVSVEIHELDAPTYISSYTE